MMIAFVAGSLEPGKDGVGDYTRALVRELIARDHSCALLAIADRHTAVPIAGRDISGAQVMRLPFEMPWAQRFRAAGKFLRVTMPDCVSLQFVPYSFQRRGLVGALAAAVPDLVGPSRLHVMFHEIWIDGGRSWLQRAVSAGQRRAILRIVRHPAAAVHTSNGTYRQVLAGYGIQADVLPLFGSVPVALCGAEPWFARELSAAGCDALDGARDRWWLFAFFGALHPVWPPLPLLDRLRGAGAGLDKRIALLSVGRLGSGERLWTEMARVHTDIPMIRLGEQPVERISHVLQTVDFGIATTPRALIGKSATAAAMFEHGLPVIVNREDCCWEGPPTIDPREAALIIRLDDAFGDRLRCARRLPAASRLHVVADHFMDAINGAAWSS